MILAGMLDFAVAIVISTGLDYTCGAFKDSTGKTSPYVKLLWLQLR